MHDLLAARPALAIAVIITLGAGAQWLAWRIRLPAILPLLSIGFLAGPVLGWIRPMTAFGPDLLFPAVSLAVGLVLFEGGLTLRIGELGDTRRVVLRLVTVGALTTWLLTAAAAHWIGGLRPALASLFGALVIVTGPTVIGPLLRIVRPHQRVANVLKWEGIVIDAVGAMVAVLVFEVLLLENRQLALGRTLVLMGQFLLAGTAAGMLGGALLAWLLRRRAVPDYLINVTSLALVFGTFAVANAFASEAGLLATVVMGMLVANVGVPNIGALLSFKEDLTVLFVSMLFIVLAANIELGAFLSAVTLPSLAVLAILIFIVRPLGVFLSSVGSPLTTPEKLYLSWIAPRGIVAAAVSSLFASKLTSAGLEGADGLVPLVFVVIVGTVLLASLTARPLGVRLGVADPDPQGFLILGAHALARNLGTALRDQGVPVLLADTNWSNVTAARADGLPAYYGSLLSDRSDDELRLSGIGRLLALTSNDEANALTALKYGREFGTNNVYQLAPGRSRNERRRLGGERRGRLLGGEDVTYGRMQQLLAAGAEVKRTDLTERFDFDAFLQRYGEDALPLFAVEAKRVRVLSDRSTPPEAGSAVIAVVRDRRAQAPTGGGGEGTPATEPADHDTRSTGAGPADVGGPAA